MVRCSLLLLIVILLAVAVIAAPGDSAEICTACSLEHGCVTYDCDEGSPFVDPPTFCTCEDGDSCTMPNGCAGELHCLCFSGTCVATEKLCDSDGDGDEECIPLADSCAELCDNDADDDGDGYADERDSACPFSLDLDPSETSVLVPQVAATFIANDGVMISGTKRVCKTGCTSFGTCQGEQLCSTTGATCTFTGPDDYDNYTYYGCFGENSAEAQLTLEESYPRYCHEFNMSSMAWESTDCSVERFECGCAGINTSTLTSSCLLGMCDGEPGNASCAASPLLEQDSSECTIAVQCQQPSLSCDPVPVCYRNNTGDWAWRVNESAAPFGVETVCDDGADNDCDGRTDMNDTDCWSRLEGHIEGEFHDIPGRFEALANATVSVLADPGFANKTDAGGDYVIALVPAGTRSVIIRKDGYLSKTATVHFPASTTVYRDWNLTSGSCNDCLEADGRCSLGCSYTETCNLDIPLVCNGSLPNTWVLNGTQYIRCCDGAVRQGEIGTLKVSGEMENVVFFNRIQHYAGRPANFRIMMWKPVAKTEE